MLEELARIPVEVEYASEFRYRNPMVDERTLVIAISQSGETADTLAAIREAKRRGARTLGLVNVVGSTIAREVDGGIYLHAGPEVGVASTKAFTSQVAALALVTLRLGRLRNLSILQGRQFIQALQPAARTRSQQILDRVRRGRGAGRAVPRQANNALYLGRGVNFPVALEGALKLKEISYIHAEGYPGGGDEARPDRADRREHAGGVHRAEGRGARQDRVEHRGGESAGRQGDRASSTRATPRSSGWPTRPSRSRRRSTC